MTMVSELCSHNGCIGLYTCVMILFLHAAQGTPPYCTTTVDYNNNNPIDITIPSNCTSSFTVTGSTRRSVTISSNNSVAVNLTIQSLSISSGSNFFLVVPDNSTVTVAQSTILSTFFITGAASSTTLTSFLLHVEKSALPLGVPTFQQNAILVNTTIRFLSTTFSTYKSPTSTSLGRLTLRNSSSIVFVNCLIYSSWSLTSLSMQNQSSLYIAGCSTTLRPFISVSGLSMTLNSSVVVANNTMGRSGAVITVSSLSINDGSAFVFNNNIQTPKWNGGDWSFSNVGVSLAICNADDTSWLAFSWNNMSLKSSLVMTMSGSECSPIRVMGFTAFNLVTADKQLGTMSSFSSIATWKYSCNYGATLNRIATSGSIYYTNNSQPVVNGDLNCRNIDKSYMCFPANTISWNASTGCVCNTWGSGPFCLSSARLNQYDGTLPTMVDSRTNTPMAIMSSSVTRSTSSSATFGVTRTPTPSRSTSFTRAGSRSKTLSFAITQTFTRSMTDSLSPMVTYSTSDSSSASLDVSPSKTLTFSEFQLSSTKSFSMSHSYTPSTQSHSATQSLSVSSVSMTPSSLNKSTSITNVPTISHEKSVTSQVTYSLNLSVSHSPDVTVTPCRGNETDVRSLLPLFATMDIEISVIQVGLHQWNNWSVSMMNGHDDGHVVLFLSMELRSGFASVADALWIPLTTSSNNDQNQSSLVLAQPFGNATLRNINGGGSSSNATLSVFFPALPSVDTVLQLSTLSTDVLPNACWEDRVPVGAIRVYRKQTAVEAAISATTATVAVVSASVQVLASSVSSSSDLQVLAIIGLMSCSQPSVRSAFGNYRTLSPTKLDDSFMGVVLGNIALGGTVFALQCVAVLVLRSGVLLKIFNDRNSLMKAATSWVMAAEAARFPGMTIGAWLALLPGTLFGSAQLAIIGNEPSSNNIKSLYHPSMVQQQVVGVLLLLLLLPLPLMTTVFLNSVDRSFDRFEHSEVIFHSQQRWRLRLLSLFAPKGLAKPEQMTNMMLPIVTISVHPSPLWGMLPFASSWLLAVASMLSANDTGCIALFSILTLCHICILGIVMWYRPYRTRIRDYISSLQLMVTTGVVVLTAAAVVDERILSSNAIAVIGSLQSLLTVVGFATGFLAIRLETFCDEKISLSVVWERKGHSCVVLLCGRKGDEGESERKNGVDGTGSNMIMPVKYHDDDNDSLELDELLDGIDGTYQKQLRASSFAQDGGDDVLGIVLSGNATDNLQTSEDLRRLTKKRRQSIFIDAVALDDDDDEPIDTTLPLLTAHVADEYEAFDFKLNEQEAEVSNSSKLDAGYVLRSPHASSSHSARVTTSNESQEMILDDLL